MEYLVSRYCFTCLLYKIITFYFSLTSINIAAYSPFGFVCWQIYLSTVGSAEVIHFITQILAPYLTESSHLILDNAKNQRNYEVNSYY